MRQRLEDRRSFDYQVARNNEQWQDHVARTLVTAALIAWQSPESILDPACGDGSVVLKSMRSHQPGRVLLTDISVPGISRLVDFSLPPQVTAKVGEITHVLTTEERFSLIVLTEILEHIPDPDMVLRLARLKAPLLIASSPEMRPGQVDYNPEHLWMFDGPGYNEMLHDAGWLPIQKTHLAFPGLPYDFQIWVCQSSTRE